MASRPKHNPEPQSKKKSPSSPAAWSKGEKSSRSAAAPSSKGSQKEDEAFHALEILEKLFANRYVLIAYLDKNFRFIRVNEAYAKADGRDTDFFCGKNHFDLYPNEENERIFRRVLERGKPYSISEKPFVYGADTERGTTYWDWSLFPVQNPAGQTDGLLLTAIDATNRVRAQEELLKHQDHLEKLVRERTAELHQINRRLKEEIRERGRAEDELKRTLDELQSTIEELRVTEEELRDQNEEMLASREVLKNESQRYLDLFELAPDGYIITDASGFITGANRNALQLLNTSSKYLAGCSFMSFVRKEDHDVFLSRFASVFRLKGKRQFGLRLQPRGKKPAFDASVSVGLIRNPKGHPEGIRWLIRDVTEHKKVEDELRFQANALSQINDAVIAVDEEQRITYWNPGAERLYELSAAEVLGRLLSETVHGDWLDSDAVNTALAEKNIWSGQNVHVTLIGKRIDVDSVITVLRNKNGEATGKLAVIRDITESKQAEQKLSRSQSRYRELYEGSHDGYVMTDLDGRFIEFNTSFMQIVGYSEPELNQMSYWDLTPRRWHAFERKIIHEQVFPRGYSDVYEKEYRRKDGVVLPIEVRKYLLKDEAGKNSGLWAFVRNISKRKEAEQELKDSEARYRRLSEQLEDMVKRKVEELQQARNLAAIGRMVAVLAHEVRNPLQTIELGAESLKRYVGQQKESAEIFREIGYGVNLLNQITTELIDFARPIQLQKSAVTIEDLIERALEVATRRFSHVAIYADLEREDEKVFVDVNRFIQVLVNLFVNAADAICGHGTLIIRSRLSADDTGRKIILSMIDNGCGIAETDLEQVCEPFFTTKTRGIGLGLPFSKRIIEAHGGAISIRSTIGKGTCVDVILPLNSETT
ncbi:MAG: PAS domain S-box protein [Candidatus Abyssobacteria bacterium SURF_5]|uniref:histidine kinase n=1 Tax=Abyssobacteria bacterium (strain SURF_5) TaxID=2093360 RepID=A0A3A4NW74_ABYX5|nr:MAG: PAS domain S-box protein [Candidatus Abyssubacteria bacterium SURF_5]